MSPKREMQTIKNKNKRDVNEMLLNPKEVFKR